MAWRKPGPGGRRRAKRGHDLVCKGRGGIGLPRRRRKRAGIPERDHCRWLLQLPVPARRREHHRRRLRVERKNTNGDLAGADERRRGNGKSLQRGSHHRVRHLLDRVAAEPGRHTRRRCNQADVVHRREEAEFQPRSGLLDLQLDVGTTVHNTGVPVEIRASNTGPDYRAANEPGGNRVPADDRRHRGISRRPDAHRAPEQGGGRERDDGLDVQVAVVPRGRGRRQPHRDHRG